MRLFKFIAMFGAWGLAASFASESHATLADYTANLAGSMGVGREVTAGTIWAATNNYTKTSNLLTAAPVEWFTAIDFGAAIPVGQKIDSATLTLYIMNFGSSAAGTDIDIPVYALNTDFTANQTTWNNRDSINAWNTAGAKDSSLDFDGTTESITTVTIPSAATGNTPFTWDLKDLIQSQYDAGTLSNGILVGGRLAAVHGTASFAGYGGVQTGGVPVSGTRPTLSINYSLAAVPEPSSFGFGLVVLGLGMARARSRKRLQ